MIRLPEPWPKLDRMLEELAAQLRLLPWLQPPGARQERERLRRALQRGRPREPAWRWRPVTLPPELHEGLLRCWRLVERLPEAARPAYRARIEELRLDAAILEALGRPRALRPLVRRRFAHGGTAAPVASGACEPLGAVAARWLAETPPEPPEPATLPPVASGRGASAAAVFEAMGRAAGLPVQVRLQPGLSARAAAAERSVLLADRRFGRREALALAVHEVLGHLVSAANARAQRVGLLRVGTAASFEDQEGLALWLEERAGLLDARRRRTLAARVLATDLVLQGAGFVEVARCMTEQHGFEAAEAVALAERACRGGGVARDAGYLLGLLRVRRLAAEADDDPELWPLRAGRVGVGALDALQAWRQAGWLREPPYRPSLSRSLRATLAGTSLETSPPRAATSLTSPEAT